MTPDERRQLQKAVSRANERAQIREAIAAGTVHGSISRQLGEELIAAIYEAQAAWAERANSEHRMQSVMDRFNELVPWP